VIYEPLVFWTLPLRSNRKSVTFEECVAWWQKEQRLEGDDMPFCDECQEQKMATHTQRVWKFAPVLAIKFHRFKQDASGVIHKNNAHVEYPMEIDTKRIQAFEQCDRPKYRLIGAIVHGGTTSGGHYTCVVRDAMNSTKWYDISDAHVRLVSEEKATPSEAYVLFYERMPMEIEEEATND
jgi:ubiquitin C-terminal hydrolase